jgi:hypothetical protein
MGRNSELKQLWELSGKDQGHRPLLQRLRIPFEISASTFISQLILFRRVIGDDRFNHAIQALHENDLVDASRNWNFNYVLHTMQASQEEFEFGILLCVLLCVSKTGSLRLACAETAVRLRIGGRSFEAVVKHIDRLWRSEAGEVFREELGRKVRHQMSNDSC